jgi:predicted amidophosphoribosyltransferase
MVWGNAQFTSTFDGVCPRCAGPVSLTLEVCDDHAGGQGEVCANCDAVFATWARRRCDVCRFDLMVPAWHHLLQHPAIAGFFFEQGVSTIPWTWETLTDEAVRPTKEAVGEGPFQLQFTFEVDGETLDATLDEELEVIGVSG